MTEDFYAAAAGPKRQPGLAFARRNQKILAERLGWPDGALAACWDLENRHPGWHVDWLSENTSPGFERPAGFRAVSRAPVHQHEVTVSAPTAAELEPLTRRRARISTVPMRSNLTMGLHGRAVRKSLTAVQDRSASCT
jgi:hypothetical protein